MTIATIYCGLTGWFNCELFSHFFIVRLRSTTTARMHDLAARCYNRHQMQRLLRFSATQPNRVALLIAACKARPELI